MNKPLLSFIIPMYNAEKYIGTCIQSILSQDLNMSEYEIVVDDGSSDAGKDVLFNIKHDNIRYFWQENNGQSSARNKGLEMANGEYVHFVDADDVLIPHSICSILDCALHFDLDMVTFNLVEKKYDEPLYDNPNSYLENVGKVSTIMSGTEYIEKYNFNNGPWWYIVKKQTLMQNKVRFVPGHYGEDGMFTMELLMHIGRIAHVNRFCYQYLLRPNSTTTNRNISHQKKMLLDYLFVYQYMQSLIGSNEGHLSEKAIERCNARSETYIFFLLARLLRYPNYNEVKKYVKKLKELGQYPVKKPYNGLKFSITTYIINNYCMLLMCNRLYNMIPTFFLRKVGIA